MQAIPGGPGGSHWWDKVPSKFDGWSENRFREAGFRAVPGAIASAGLRLCRVLARRGARPAQIRESTPVDGVTVKSGRGAVSVSISKAGANAAFGKWLDDNIDEIIKEQYRAFTTVNDAD